MTLVPTVRPRTRLATMTATMTAAMVLLAGCGGSTGAADRTPAVPAGIAADQPVELFLGLARDQAGLQEQAARTNPTAPAGSPGGPVALSELARRFGASESTTASLRQAFPAGSVTVSATGGFARLVLPITDAEQRFGLSWQVTTVDGVTVLTAAGSPQVPAGLRDVVTEVLPRNRILLGGAGGPGSSPAAPSASAAAGDPVPVAAPDPAACQSAIRAGSALVADSGLQAVHSAGFGGAGARVSVVALTAVDQPAFDQWLSCLGRPAVAVRELPTRETTTLAAPDAESQLDLAALSLALPSLAAVTVVQAGAADWVGDALATALTDPAGQPEVIASSIVFCEKQPSPAAISMTEYVLAAAVASGTLVVAASGDHGSSACAPGDRAAAVDYPASSPNVLAIGGVDGSGAVWADPTGPAAAGGGASAVFPGRTVPDLAAVAAAPDLPPIPVCAPVCAWQRYAGTSFAAPFVAGALVAVNEQRRARGQSGVSFGVGRLDRTVDPGTVTDVVRGSNDLYSVGCCAAAAGYDQASGYGLARFDVLAAGGS